MKQKYAKSKKNMQEPQEKQIRSFCHNSPLVQIQIDENSIENEVIHTTLIFSGI